MSNVNNDMSLREIKAEYYKHIQVLAEDLKECHGDSVGADAINDAAESSDWVTYNYFNRLVYLVSDNSEAIDQEDIFVDVDNLDAMRASFAVVADLVVQLEDME